jgi:hypothetical protein
VNVCLFVVLSWSFSVRALVLLRGPDLLPKKDINRDCIFDGEEIIERPAT